MKLFDSEWKVMEVLWQQNDQTAKAVSLHLAQSAGWNKNTTYTVIKKCIDKGAIERREPNFVCHALISKQQAQTEEAQSLVDKVFGGSAELLFGIPAVGPFAQQRGTRPAQGAGGGARGMTGLQAAIVSGSALIVIIALLRAALRRHLPARLFPALWCVAAVRLLLPVSIPTRISIWNLFSTRASSPGGMVSETLTAFPALAQTTASAVSPDPAAQVPVLPLIWLSGALLLGLYFALGYAHSIKTLRAGSLAPSPVEALLLDLFGFANRPAIRASKNPRAPVTFGTVRPVIVLPEDSALDRTQLSLVLAHELAHVRRKDCLRKLLLTVCLCVHFWNPLVWGMVVLANRDMELACDEKVLSVLGSGFKKQYALTLLSVAQRQQRSSCLCSAFAKRPLEARIVSILNFRRMPVWTGMLAAAAFLLSACVLATQAAPSAASAAPEPVEAVLASSLPETGGTGKNRAGPAAGNPR